MKMANFSQYCFIVGILTLCFAMPFIALFLFILTFIVAIHEYGHLKSARRHGVTVTDYSIGMGKVLYTWVSQNSGTSYHISALPLGGYVRMLHKQGDGTDKRVTRLIQEKQGIHYLQDIHPLKRIEVLGAGVFLNFITAILFFAILIFVRGETVVEPVVDSLKENAAAVTELKIGDRILSVNGKNITNLQEAIPEMVIAGNKPVQLVVVNNRCYNTGSECATRTIQHTTVVDETGKPDIGFYVSHSAVSHEQVGILSSLYKGTLKTYDITVLQGKALYRMISGQIDWQKMLSGPVGIAKATGDVLKQEQAQEVEENAKDASTIKPIVMTFLSLTALISVAIGFMNLLPIPALDGGHIMFTIIAWVTGKEIPDRIQQKIVMVGFILLIGMFALGLFADLNRIF